MPLSPASDESPSRPPNQLPAMRKREATDQEIPSMNDTLTESEQSVLRVVTVEAKPEENTVSRATETPLSESASTKDIINGSLRKDGATTDPSDTLDLHGIPDLSNISSHWSGWCEIESDPAFFNVILKEWGVRGVKVYELFSLDDMMLAQLPNPVYGLVFLFRWVDHGDQPAHAVGDQGPTGNVWFANQVPDNACATIALLNILMNMQEDVEIGEHLTQFKRFTTDMSPAMRGLAIDNFQFIKDTHNSFGRKIDMLTDDCGLSEKAEDTKKRKPKRRRYEQVAALHFNAFLPIDGELLKLDGLDERPCSLGPTSPNNWLSDTRSTLEDRMTACQTAQYEFAVLAVARDPLVELEEKLKRINDNISKVSARIKQLDPSWTGEDTSLWMADRGKESNESVRDEDLPTILASETLSKVIAHYLSLHRSRRQLHLQIDSESQSAQEDESKARNRRFDFEPAMRYWISCLARKGRLKEMLDWADEYTR